MNRTLFSIRGVRILFLARSLLGGDLQHLFPFLLAFLAMNLLRCLLRLMIWWVDVVICHVMHLLVYLAFGWRHLVFQLHEERVGRGEAIDYGLHNLGGRVPQPSPQLPFLVQFVQGQPEYLFLLIAQAVISDAESVRLLGILLLLHR